MLSQKRMVLSSFLFGMGWFTISFTFPLEADYYGLGKILTGLLGLAVSVPFPVVAFIYLKGGDRHLFALLLASQIIIAVLCSLFILPVPWLFVMLVAGTGVLQGFYWVSLEVSIGSVPGERSAEKYSAAWGVPSFISPVIAGFLLQYINFTLIAVISAIILISAVPFVQRYRIVIKEKNTGRPDLYFIIPLLFAGIFLGYFSYSLIPMLRISGFEYYVLGIYGSVLGAAMAIGFLAFSFINSDNIKSINLMSAVLMATPIVIAFSRDMILMGAVIAMAGFGVAMAFSKVLSYISGTTDPVKGTFYYELFLAIGYGSGSTLGGFISSYYGYLSALAIFMFPVAYVLYLTMNRDHRYSHYA